MTSVVGVMILIRMSHVSSCNGLYIIVTNQDTALSSNLFLCKKGRLARVS